jgi:hypothetical protein
MPTHSQLVCSCGAVVGQHAYSLHGEAPFEHKLLTSATGGVRCFIWPTSLRTQHPCQVLAPRPPGRAGDGFAPAKKLAEVSLAQVSLVSALSLQLLDPTSRLLAVRCQHSMYWRRSYCTHHLEVSFKAQTSGAALQSGAAFSGSAKAAAIAVGALDTPAKEFVRPFPKQVLLCTTQPVQAPV